SQRPPGLAKPQPGIAATPPPLWDPGTPAAAPPVAPSSPPPAAPASDAPTGLAPLAGLRSGEEPTNRKPATTPTDFGGPSHTAAPGGLPEIQYVRDLQVGLDFEIERKGPSGVKKIETYITPDDGKTWFRYAETTDPNPPLNLALPKDEGIYGFRMVVYSGVMQSEGPPKTGMPPDVRIHVDRTPPAVE